MTDKRNPDLFGGDGHEYWTDITLRDIFAAFCAAGLTAKFGDDRGMNRENARASYAFADALLAERKHSEGEEHD
jgi:hypothetical protein